MHGFFQGNDPMTEALIASERASRTPAKPDLRLTKKEVLPLIKAATDIVENQGGGGPEYVVEIVRQIIVAQLAKDTAYWQAHLKEVHDCQCGIA